MAEVEIYSSAWCPYCIRARRLLDSKGVGYRVHDVDGDRAVRAEMMRRAGCRTVPQIFVDRVHLGDCDELYELERRGALDGLLGRT